MYLKVRNNCSYPKNVIKRFFRKIFEITKVFTFSCLNKNIYLLSASTLDENFFKNIQSTSDFVFEKYLQ